MILKILIGIILLALFYFYIYPTQIEKPKNTQQKSFIPSDSFIGAKKGYVFKKDYKGLGYYLDDNTNYTIDNI